MLLCLFVFLWKILRDMSTISATIQQERQLELLKLQLLDHQRRRLRHLQKVQQQQQQVNCQKLRKMGRDKCGSQGVTAAKENFLLARFLFGGGRNDGTIPEDGAGEKEEEGLNYFGGDCASDKDLKFLRMSDYPEKQQQQSGKFVLSQQQQNQNQHPPPPPSPLAGVIHQRRHCHLSQQNSPLHRHRRPLASSNNSNFNFGNGNVGPTPTPTAAAPPTSAGSFHCYEVVGTRTERNGNVVDGEDGDSLKSNVQIVLDNINRNYHALREQILNNHQLNQLNNNNNGNNVNLSQDTNHNLALLQQRLQSVTNGQLKKGGAKMAATSPADSDSNCNPYLPATAVPLSCSIASSQDFSHDYSDYQWFMDYGSYRDGITHQSILSALSASYNGIGELSYYEDLAKNIDANLAEVDMESFRTEDIHSLLTTNSAEFRHSRGGGGGGGGGGGRNNNRGESITGLGTASRSGLELNLAGIGGGQLTTGMDSSEICKSELLFSPVKESHISVDSLDMDGYPDEDDIILTCQANKNNYTIAFEQSALLYSDESFYDGPENYGKQQQYRQMNTQQMNFNNLDQLIRRKAEAMSSSEVGYTTWSKLRNNAGPGQRFPLVTAANPFINQISRHAPTCFVRKSLSMPDLKEKCSGSFNRQADLMIQEPHHHNQLGGEPAKHQINVSQVVPQVGQQQGGQSCAASSESYGKQMRTLLPMPSDFGGNCGGGGGGSNADGSHADSSCDNNEDEDPSHQNAPSNGQQHQPSFNLVKLFIKQKSSSSADTTCMDVSSGCWPSDSSSAGSGTAPNGGPSSANGGSENNNNSNTNLAVASSKEALRSRKKSMNDSGKCSSTLGRHEEEEFQFDSLDPVQQDEQGKLNDFNSPAHKRNYKAYNMNIAGKNQPPMNPAVYNLMNNNGSGGSGSSSITNQQNNNNNNNNSFKDTNSDASRTSENLTQIFNVARSNSGGAADKTRVPIEMITKSMQTSFIGAAKDKVRVVPPSFLDRLQKLGDKQKAPVFVVYPNYVLPDLGFLNTQQKDVVISPLSFKENFGSKSATAKKPRPVSMNDIENIKAKEYKHVMDWKSLVTLLPQEYRKLLRNIPEANAVASEDAGQKPLFCMTPPLRRGRGVTCDCVNLLGQTQTYNSSSSGGSSSQPPSSGYRGSSTMLTDSEMDLLGPSATNFSNNMYVYQYDSPAEVSSAERPPSGRTPKGILRRAPTKAKRNSMFEENQQRAHTAEKRRSLQEPCYNFSDEQLSILEEQPPSRKVNNSPNLSQHQPRLPNTPKLPSADDYHRLNKLNELNDFELKQAVTSKLTQRANQPTYAPEDDLEARIRAEHFLSNVPKSELKHYADIAHVLETTTAEGATAPSEDAYDRNRLRHEVSRALSQRKNVSFNSPQPQQPPNNKPQLLRPTEIKFTTPPNSPNMSVVGQRPPAKPTTPTQPTGAANTQAEREKQDKIQSNRFKRLQIQWELLSKEGQQLKQELQQPRSGGNTPTGAMKSRIPRPVSYPTTRANSDPMVSKTLKSPSRIVPPSAKKKFGTGSASNIAAAAAAAVPQPAPRTPSKLLHTTPKKSPAPATGPRPATRTRIPLGPSSSLSPLSKTASSPAVVTATQQPKSKPVIRKPITTPVVRPPIGRKSTPAAKV